MIELTRAADTDAPAIAEVFLASFHATYDFPLAHTDEEVRGWVRDDLVRLQETWVAVDDARVVGMMVVTPGHLEQLYVAPDQLGRGIGRRLLDLAKDRSPAGLSLWTFQVNDRARRFYERNGFVAVEFGDGSTNEEHQPDVRYEWSGNNEAPGPAGESRASGPNARRARGARRLTPSGATQDEVDTREDEVQLAGRQTPTAPPDPEATRSRADLAVRPRRRLRVSSVEAERSRLPLESGIRWVQDRHSLDFVRRSPGIPAGSGSPGGATMRAQLSDGSLRPPYRPALASPRSP